ncbi:MAG: dicarboxylate/amino acid:cation symporter [Planctomycetes bacterium]|nr:dicarboxylate/amino acid:cation symporter [Planctomycetota bacterium]MBI3845590.1 dicarboxylate/amino acid:cation symporter [Planctomycetota bacterium]
MTLPSKVFVGLVVGVVVGSIANALAPGDRTVAWIVENVAKPGGKIFFNMLFMVVYPLILASLALGVASLGDLGRLGRVAARTLIYFVVSTAIAVAIGLVLVNAVKPGHGLSPETRDELMRTYSGEAAQKIEAGKAAGGFGVQTFVNIVPRNPVAALAQGDALPVIFFALMLGVALTLMRKERAEPMIRLLEAINDAMGILIDLAMKLAPYGVALLLFSVTAQFGMSLLQKLGLYVVVVLVGLLVHQFVVFSIAVRTLGGMSPFDFFRRIRTVMITAFSTSSSNATLPTSIRIAEQELGVPRQIAGFVLPLGATMNMNGTSLFEGVTVLFLAQVFGVELSLGHQVIVIVLSVLTAIGAAGVPSGSIPLLGMVITTATNGKVDATAIALVLGVDRILDMSRTVLNVTGDLTAALYVARVERERSATSAVTSST